ncbi:unnamed protein product, partial [marine sediment metagenome]
FFDTISNDDLGIWLGKVYLAMRENRHAYVMCDAITLPYFYYYAGFRKPCSPCIYLDNGGVVPFANMKPLIWDKVSMGMGYHYRCRYEFIVMLDKGKNRHLANLSIPDVLEFPSVQGKEKLCPTQKPLRLFELLIRQSTIEGELVLDAFLGSGTTAVACKKLNRKCIAYELNEERCEIAANRCRQTVMEVNCDG